MFSSDKIIGPINFSLEKKKGFSNVYFSLAFKYIRLLFFVTKYVTQHTGNFQSLHPRRDVRNRKLSNFSGNLCTRKGLVIVVNIKTPLPQITVQTARNIAELSETDNQAITVQSVAYMISACSEALVAARTKR